MHQRENIEGYARLYKELSDLYRKLGTEGIRGEGRPFIAL